MADTARDDAIYQGFYQEALGERMLWVKMDTDTMRDYKVRRLCASPEAKERYARFGMYVATILHMAENDGHIYDLSDDIGWTFYANDMGLSVEEAMLFVKACLEVGLFDAELFGESAKLASNRLLREAEETAQNKAASRAKVAKMNEARSTSGSTRASTRSSTR